MPLANGASLGPYEIVELIGQGGMGEVYRARDPRLRRDVAIKTSKLGFGERFEREAHAIAALNHSNICHIYDVGPDYLVMELVGGQTLRHRLAQGPLALDEAMRIADQIAEALAAAHEKFIVHRDLKPDNIKLEDNGTVKVLDFGLARFGAPAGETRDLDESPTLTMSLTAPGVILGTAAYMSPEQARGRAVDTRSDIWSFGVVLYEMLTGRKPFKGDDLADTLAAIVKDAPDLSAVPPRVRRLIGACLEKDPRQRLQAIGDRHLLLATPEPARVTRFWPSVAGALAMVAATFAAFAWMQWRQTPDAVQVLRYQMARGGDSRFVQFQLSPDGRQLAFTVRAGASTRLFVRRLDSLDEHEIPGTEDSSYPFWSPDSAHIGFFSQGKLKRVALIGGPATTLADAPDSRGGTWGANDSILFTASASGTISLISAAGGPATPLVLRRESEGPRDSLRFPRFLPGSDRFLYTIESDTRERAGVYVGSLSGDPPVRILPDLAMTQFVPDSGSSTIGHVIFRRDRTLMAEPFDMSTMKATGDAFPLATEVLNSGNTGFGDFSASLTGTLMYTTGVSTSQDREIVWLGDSGTRSDLMLTANSISNFALSPDGGRLMYSSGTQLTTGDLWLFDIARKASQRLTHGPFSAYSLVWSPREDAAVFSAYPEDRLYRRSLPSQADEPLSVAGTNTYATSWSADGRFLLYSQTSATTRDDLWILPIGTRNGKATIFKQTPFNEAAGQFSPDGQWIAYHSDASRRTEVYIASSTPGGEERQVSVDGGTNPRWRSDGRVLFYLSSNKTMMAVDVSAGPPLSLGAPRELFRETKMIAGSRETSFEPSADGRRFLALLSTRDEAASPITVVTGWQSAYRR